MEVDMELTDTQSMQASLFLNVTWETSYRFRSINFSDITATESSNWPNSSFGAAEIVNRTSRFWLMDETVLRHSWPWTIVFICAYLTVFFLGVIGNSMVVCVVVFRPAMRTVTNMFILNLAVADLFVTLFCTVPNLLASIFIPWILGSVMCKAVAYIQGVSVCASVYSLVAISLDRFLAIWFPTRTRGGLHKRHARGIICCIWVAACLVILPWALFFTTKTKDQYEYCVDDWPESMDGNVYFLVANVIICYGLPLFSISVFYMLIWCRVIHRKIPSDMASIKDIRRMHRRTKLGVLKMLIFVILIFLLSWLPLYAIFTRIKFGGELTDLENEVISISLPIAQWLGASNSCVNPILYAFLNSKFREAFKSLIFSPRRLQRNSTITSYYLTQKKVTFSTNIVQV